MTDTMKTATDIAETALTCVIDSDRGIYVGQRIGQLYGKVLDSETREILLAGPDHEYYWSTWDEAEQEITFEHDGDTYGLHNNDGNICEVNYSMIERWQDSTGLDFWETL